MAGLPWKKKKKKPKSIATELYGPSGRSPKDASGAIDAPPVILDSEAMEVLWKEKTLRDFAPDGETLLPTPPPVSIVGPPQEAPRPRETTLAETMLPRRLPGQS